ncbi:MAG: AmmeMemoRadiSam system protein B [Candidatus Omnitrophica bacterium]|nr:AmmeMemoRadiSam system protein B [Candidatus Omnitrophota bacterium]
MKSFWSGLIILMAMTAFARGDNNIKSAGLAGSWYPGSQAELSSMLDQDLAAVKDVPVNADIAVIVSPHAGYVFSAPVAAYGFKAAAANKKVSTVIILAPSHHISFKGAAVWSEGGFETPLGVAAVDTALAQKILAADKRFSFRQDVFTGIPGRAENSVETQIPLIQKVFPEAKIVPVILGFPPEPDVLKSMAQALALAVGDRDDVLVDVSVDQSHFHSDKEARAIDQVGLNAIEAMDIDALWQGHQDGRMEVDGFHVVATAMMYAKARGFNKAKVLRHATSADVTKDLSSVVGYASIMMYRDRTVPGIQPLSMAQRKRLVHIARTALDAFVRTGKAPAVDEDDARLSVEEGAFVTLTKQGQLRGCIGNIMGQGPLFKTVRAMAVAAASEDPRFNPVTADELNDIDVEVSVLSRPRLARADEIVLGTHGVIVRQGRKGGVFLPQVATETGWSKERFMSELCAQKAGLPPECWKDPLTTIEIFTADVFGEKE